MSYIGKSPPTSGKDAGASFDIDDISGEFNGSTTAFDIEVGGTALSPTTTNVFIFLGGVLQHPGDAYTVSGSQIAFTAAPDSGVSFHGTILGHTRTITPDQGTVADSSFAASAITAISGSFTAVSSSLASRISSEEGEAEGSVISSSAQIAADISGSITSTSSSIATRFDSRETDMTLATASIAAITASISTAKTDISTNTSNMTLATASIAAITSSVSTINSNMTLATASIAAITASVSSLKSTSFAGTAGTETVFSGSAASTGSFGRAIISGDVDINSEGGMVGPIAPWVRLNKINLGSSTSELDITTGFGATYDTYMIVCENVHCGTDNVVLRMRFFIDGSIVDGGGNYNYHVQQSHSGNANYEAGAQDYSGATSMINLIAEQGNAAGESCSGIVYIHAPSVENFQHYAHYYFVGMRTDSSVNMGRGVGGYVSDTDELTGVRFYYSSGNLDDGTFTLYGLSK